jgi:NitT/TauT family transport system ATP-binding protein
MRQRVNLARALAVDPAILLLDEPFSALDAQTRALMENDLLAIWGAGGKTILFITHDLDEAIALSDTVAVMTAGPGRIKTTRRVDLPRPRDLLEIRSNPQFSDIHAQLWDHLRDEVVGRPQ